MSYPRRCGRATFMSASNDRQRRPFALIAGPCQIESRSHAIEMCHALVEAHRKLGIGFIYKSSFDKANRTSIDSQRGVVWRRG